MFQEHFIPHNPFKELILPKKKIDELKQTGPLFGEIYQELGTTAIKTGVIKPGELWRKIFDRMVSSPNAQISIRQTISYLDEHLQKGAKIAPEFLKAGLDTIPHILDASQPISNYFDPYKNKLFGNIMNPNPEDTIRGQLYKIEQKLQQLASTQYPQIYNNTQQLPTVTTFLPRIPQKKFQFRSPTHK